MSARILVVDDNPLNVKLLAAKLARDYYIVTSAENGPKALQMAAREKPDLILLDVMMPDMSGFEVCQRIKADPATRHIPVIMVTALSDTSDRVRGLEAGADDFLTKPINDVALMARVRSSLRLKMSLDEWRLREATAAQFATLAHYEEAVSAKVEGMRVLLLEDSAKDCQSIIALLRDSGLNVVAVDTIATAVLESQTGIYDLVMTSLDLAQEDGLMLCAQLRAHDKSRTLPILLLANEGETERVAKGLDLGANDYLIRPIEGSELIARTRTQLKQKNHYDRLRQNYEKSLSLALVDPLTGAFNRRYLDTHMPKMFTRYRATQSPISVLSIDIDHFKNINDTHGHAAGDEVLKEIVNRISQNLRPLDLVVRMGGEEFAVLLPDTDQATAMGIAERLRTAFCSIPFSVPGVREPLQVTASFGIASVAMDRDDSPSAVLQRADNALYSAKQTGRNKVVGATDKEAALA